MYRAYVHARLRVRKGRVGQHAAHRRDRQAAAGDWRSCWVSTAMPSTRSSRKWRTSPQQVVDFLNELAVRPSPTRNATWEAHRVRARRAQARQARSMGSRLRVGKAARCALRVLRPGSETVFPGNDACCPACSRLVETLYGLTITPAEAPTWHPDVRFFAIRDRDGDLVGQFYIDLYARPSKRGGAWMDEAITRRRKDGGVQTPVAYLNCNFSGAGRRQTGAVHAR